MCTFCVKHGDGKRWYRNAANYAADLESDLRRRGFMVSFVRKYERNRKLVNAGLGALRFMPEPLRKPAVDEAGRAFQEHHFGQPVPIEECARIFDIATNITRVPCVCRGSSQPGSNAESCCIVATVLPHRGLLDECFRDYRGGPHAEGFHQLTKDEALEYLRKTELRGLAHTAWTFQTPFIAAICNCDLPSGCMAMKLQLRGGVRIMWKGEDVARLDAQRCSGCGECVPRCPFGVIRSQGPRMPVALDRAGCWGCGSCRASCARGALALEPREGTELAGSW